MNEHVMDGMKMFLEPTYTIDSGSDAIAEKANELTGQCLDMEEKAVRLFYYVRDEIRYNVYMISAFEEDFRASQVLLWKKGYCVQKAVLLAALGRAAGIPSRLAFAKIKNHRVPSHLVRELGTNVFPRHGYNQFFINGKWVSSAATFDRELCRKNGLPLVEFDGKRDAVLPERDLSGRPYIEYIKKFDPTADLPFEWIFKRISKIVGEEKRPWLSKV